MLKYPLSFLFVSGALIAWLFLYSISLATIYDGLLWFGDLGDDAFLFWYDSFTVPQITSILMTLAFWPITKLFKLGPNIVQESGKLFQAFGIYFIFGTLMYWIDLGSPARFEQQIDMVADLVDHKFFNLANDIWSGSIAFTLIAFIIWIITRAGFTNRGSIKSLIWKERYAIAGFTVFIVFGLITSGEYSFFELIFMVALVSPVLGIFMGIYTMFLARVAWTIIKESSDPGDDLRTIRKGFSGLREDPTEIEVPADKTQEEINTGIVKRSDGIFLRDDLYCAWCGSHVIVLQSSELGKKVFEYRNQDGSRDKRVSDNTYEQSFRGIWQCPNCGAKTKTWSFLSDRPSKKTTIRNSLLWEDGLGERLAEDYEDNSGTRVSGANRKSDS